MSIQGVTPFAFQADVLDAITAAMGLLDGSKIQLLKELIVPTPAVTLAQCVAAKADYTGYMAQTVAAWQVAAKGPDGLMRVDGDNLQFLASGIVVSNTIYGAYMTDTTGMVLQQVWLLPTPIIMGVDVLQAVDFTPCFYFPSP
jgi:hypothetical protein